MNADPLNAQGQSARACRIRLLIRGMARADNIAAHYRRFTLPVLRRLAAEVIAGTYDGAW